jgi:UDP-N-acetylglucosamine 2-epimerase (non-hydrolysing)
MNTVVVFFGTRPEAIKMAPVVAALRAQRDLKTLVVSTGQHREMLQQVVDLFGIGVDRELAVMQPNQTLAGLTARLLTGVDDVLQELRPDLALAQGDTTTALAAALGSFYRKVPFGHVEAGLRTGDVHAPFPEEVNRRLVTTMTTLHFAPTQQARANLAREGVAEAQIWVTGNTVIDALQIEVQRQEHEARHGGGSSRQLAELLGEHWERSPFVLITGHRRENFGEGFRQICQAIAVLAERFPQYRFIYPVHLNPNVQGPVQQYLGSLANVRLIPPQGYGDFVALMRSCRLILTDSGGVQEEAPSLGKPVLVMRDTTERPEGVEAGTVLLVGPHADLIVAHASHLLNDPVAYQKMADVSNPYGDGRAAARIVTAIRAFLDDQRAA